MDFQDPDLEKIYAFGRLLITKLTLEGACGPLAIDDEVRLAYYRLSKTYEGNTSLTPGDTARVGGPGLLRPSDVLGRSIRSGARRRGGYRPVRTSGACPSFRLSSRAA